MRPAITLFPHTSSWHSDTRKDNITFIVMFIKVKYKELEYPCIKLRTGISQTILMFVAVNVYVSGYFDPTRDVLVTHRCNSCGAGSIQMYSGTRAA
jgi:hypothetical protein